MTIHFGTDGWRAVISDTFTFTNLRMLSQAIAVAGAFTFVATAALAGGQSNAKRVLAYSSVNHLGYCLLALFAVARQTDGQAGEGDQPPGTAQVLLAARQVGATGRVIGVDMTHEMLAKARESLPALDAIPAENAGQRRAMTR